MTPVNTDRRAVAIGVVGVMAILTTLAGFDVARVFLSSRTEKQENFAASLKAGKRVGYYYDVGKLRTWEMPDGAGPIEWRVKPGMEDDTRETFKEEGPYVITYTVRGERHQELLNQKEVGGRALVLREASKEPSKIIQDIKVFRSYRIDPEELEGKK